MIRQDTPEEVEGVILEHFPEVKSCDIHLASEVKYKKMNGDYRNMDAVALIQIKVTFFRNLYLLLAGTKPKLLLDIHRIADKSLPEGMNAIVFIK